MPQASDEEAYIDFCSRPRQLRSRQVQQDIANHLQAIRTLQHGLFERRRAHHIWEQGHIITAIILRRDALRDMARLAEQHYVVDLCAGRETTVTVAAQLAGGGRLTIDLDLTVAQKVIIQDPSPNGQISSPLLQTALEALLADGRLPELVTLAAQTLRLTLAAPPDRPSLDAAKAGDAYFRQKARLCEAMIVTAEPPARQDDLFVELNRHYHELHCLQQRLAEGNQPDVQERERYRRDFRRLAAWEHVRDLKVSGDTISLYTDTIHVDGVCLGDFRITMDFAAGSVLLENLTRAISSGGTRYDGPHIMGGSPCLGNIAQAVPQYLAEGRADRLIPLLISFVGSYNPSSPFIPLSSWAGSSAYIPTYDSTDTSSSSDSY